MVDIQSLLKELTKRKNLCNNKMYIFVMVPLVLFTTVWTILFCDK
jgi:formate hydrogenlyase subunit 4